MKHPHRYLFTIDGIKRCMYCDCKVAGKAAKKSCKGQYKEVKNENIPT